MKYFEILVLLFFMFFRNELIAQIIINEGSNKNYSTISDEDGDFPDWIELYNAGTDTVQLLNYSLTDDIANPTKWVFPNVSMLPGEFKAVYCSGKNRRPVSGFKHVLNTGSFNAVVGWNTHTFSSPFYWDGISNILINTCSYSSTGYTTNSVFNQSATPFNSTLLAFQDGSPYICSTNYGTPVSQRPNIKFNTAIVGNGVIQNSPYDYPAPYGNWYWAAKHQMLILGSELSSAGLSEGDISSISFDVASTDPNTFYDYIDIYMKMVSINEVSNAFEPVDTNNNLHTNFLISTAGETIYLYSPAQIQLSSLAVNCSNLDNSIGLFPDASSTISLFQTPTPSSTNNLSDFYSGYLLAPVFSLAPGFYNALSLSISISNPNGSFSSIRYTTDGSDPTESSTLYTGSPIHIFSSSVLKARAFADTVLQSPITVSSYFMGVSHVTPILSVVTDNANLYGAEGIFDNWQFDWQKAAYVEYFDSTRQLIFSQNAGMQIDGGAGGSRSNPQHSFRLELNHSVLGDGTVNYPVIPNRPYRTKYSSFYLRNGSNQYLIYPYKDACQEETMGGETNNYYSAWRPVSVYINGAYFGLYELREKFDEEYFNEQENADPDSTSILSQSYWYGGSLRPVVGSVDSFYTSFNSFNSLDPADTAFWNLADPYFDMKWYNDYIIAESWMGNIDWPYNNIKIYRSNKTNYRWRFCIIDMELAMAPNSATDCYFDHINFMLNYDPSNQYINIWQKGIQNAKFKNYFINRFADLMNTSYHINRTIPIENSMYNQTVLEMEKEYARWGDPNNVPQQMSDFYNNHLTFQSQISERSNQVRNHIVSNFALNGQVDVTLNVIPEGAGIIKINTIIPDSLPWTGIYFDGNPVRITVIPNPGFDFQYWDVNSVLTAQDTNLSIELNISFDAVFNAVFTVSPFAGKLAVSELNYHSDSTRNSGDWIEFHNYGNGALNISGWRFSDGVIYHNYVFPESTIIQPGDYLVVAEDTLKFHSQHPGIPVLGPLEFSFSNSNETLSLFNYSNDLTLSVHYDDSIPWPIAADGYGRTLEFLNDTLNPSIPENWFAGCIGGSPGEAYSACEEEIIFSEINYQSALTTDAGDWVELHNLSSQATDISGWQFKDNDNTHIFTIPLGTILPPSGYLVVFGNATSFNSRFPSVTNKTGPFSFGLSNFGEAIRLFDATGRLYQSVVYDEASPWPSGAAGNGFTLELLDTQGNFCDGTNWANGCLEGSPGGPIAPCEDQITFTELNYHSDSTINAGDWIELYNFSNNPADISGWKFTDSIISHNFIFPEGTIIQPGEWLVLAEDTALFHSQHPGIPVMGPLGFNFDNSNQALSLLYYSDYPVISMHYQDSIPWQNVADGFGRTLEIINETLDPAQPTSWFGGCIGGSPGGPFSACNEQIIFSEINYHSDPTMDAGDWVELYNKASVATDISGWKFSDVSNANIYTLPNNTILPASGYLVIFGDEVNFNYRFSSVTNKVGPFPFDLNDIGDALRLYNDAGKLNQSMVYYEASPWPQGAAGNGYTLELIDTSGSLSDGLNWMDGCPEGSPGGPYFFPCFTTNTESSSEFLNVQFFPNPSNGKFNINIEKQGNETAPVLIEIFNVVGERILETSITKRQNSIPVDISNNAKGIYFVKVYIGNRNFTGKIVLGSK